MTTIILSNSKVIDRDGKVLDRTFKKGVAFGGHTSTQTFLECPTSLPSPPRELTNLVPQVTWVAFSTCASALGKLGCS